MKSTGLTGSLIDSLPTLLHSPTEPPHDPTQPASAFLAALHDRVRIFYGDLLQRQPPPDTGRGPGSAELQQPDGSFADAPRADSIRDGRGCGLAVTRGGLINLDHPRAHAAGLSDGPEAIRSFFSVPDHPRFGTFLVDSGVETGFRNPDANPGVAFFVEPAMKTDALPRSTPPGPSGWRRASKAWPGVFLTHLQLDHLMGLPDVPPATRVYAGPGEPEVEALLNLSARGTIDRMLEKLGPLEVWPFEPDPNGRFSAEVEVFGDGSVWALQVPGHSPGSTA